MMATALLDGGPETDLATIIRAYHDVTERLKHSHDVLSREVCRLREELQSKNKELQRRQRLSALGQMAAGVAHEIRNPLGGIGLYASLLDRDLSDCPSQLDVVRKMRVGIRNLEGIVSDILTFAGDAEPNRHGVLLHRVLEAVHDQTEPNARARGVILEMDPTIGSVEVFFDPAQLERAMINLLLNAIDAAGAGGRVWINAVDADRPGSFIELSIEDDGPGIAPSLLHRVFDPFFTTKDTGTGLGLAIVHRILESNGGSIHAGNREAGGARFTLSLPRGRGSA
jgi:signal transduction histidine kinase